MANHAGNTAHFEVRCWIESAPLSRSQIFSGAKIAKGEGEGVADRNASNRDFPTNAAFCVDTLSNERGLLRRYLWIRRTAPTPKCSWSPRV